MAPGPALLSDKALLRRLVAIDSVSGRPTAPIVDLLRDYLDRPGIDVTRVPGPAPERESLVAWVGPPLERGAPREGLVLSGHLDVVPPGDAASWRGDPFELRDDDGRLVGRGACDMKASVALAANLAVAAAATPPPRPLVLVLTCDEELGSLGAGALVRSWPADRPFPGSAIIGEPTSLRAVRMHKGHLTARVVVRGVSAHSGSPHLGDNAILRARAVIDRIQAFADELAGRPSPHADHFPGVPHPVVTVATIRGGDALNVVPERCEIEIGVRLLPGMDSAAALERLVASVAGDHVEVRLLNDNPPMLTAADAPIHRALCSALGQTESLGVSFASDGGHLATLGIDCVLFGPGSIEVAHKPEEFVPEAEMLAARKTLDKLVDEFCLK